MASSFPVDRLPIARDPDANPLVVAGAGQLARRIRAGEVSSREAVEATLARIEQVNPAINALVVPLFDRARRDAASADQRQARGESLGALHGVPITVKECLHVAGTPSTIGLTHRRQPLGEDGVLVRRLYEAGAILLGKTNVPQLMIWHETDNPVYGRTNNPWDLQRGPGGSTGGDAALLAAGGTALGLGTDLGGSVRLPCHFCGVHGIKPTSHRLPRSGMAIVLHGFEAMTFQPGPMARRVEDLGLAMQVLVDPPAARRDDDVPPVPLGDFRQVQVDRLRIGVWADDGVFSPSPAIRRLVDAAAGALADQGARTEPYQRQDVGEAIAIYLGLVGADGGADGRRLLRGSTVDPRNQRLSRLARLSPLARTLLVKTLRWQGNQRLAEIVDAVRPLSADQFWQLTWRMKQYIQRFMDDWHRRELDAIIMPAHALPAMQHGKPIDLLSAASYAFLPNLLGVPAGVVSLSRVRAGEQSDRPPSRDLVVRRAIQVEQGSEGLPIGVQVIAAHWREDIVLAVMGALERAFEGRDDFPSTGSS